jgi:hypothetical protein
MVNFYLMAFAIIALCLFCLAFVAYGTQMRASIAAYRAAIFSFQGCGIIAVLCVVRHLIGLLYL